MEAQAEVTYSGNHQFADGRLRWNINNFSKIECKMVYSHMFYAGGCKWRIQIYPKGNNKVGYFSMYLEVADSETLPEGWSKHVQFRLSVLSQNITLSKESKSKFNACACSWGFASLISLVELNDPKRGFLVGDTCTVEAEVRLNEEEDKKQLKRKVKADPDQDVESTLPPQEPRVVETEKSSCSFAEFDTLFSDLQNLLEGENSKLDNFSSFPSPSWSVEEIANAKHIFKQYLDMDLASVIQFGLAVEFKYSLSILLSSNSFPDNKVDEITKFLADFDQSYKQYEAAQQDLSEAQDKEESIFELKTNVKKLSSEFLRLRNQAEAFEREISWLERRLIEKKAKNAQVVKRLEVLAGRATTSKQALINAEQDMKLSSMLKKKEQAEKVIGNIDNSWESLKVGHSI